jgi:hypothetical protein
LCAHPPRAREACWGLGRQHCSEACSEFGPTDSGFNEEGHDAAMVWSGGLASKTPHATTRARMLEQAAVAATGACSVVAASEQSIGTAAMETESNGEEDRGPPTIF